MSNAPHQIPAPTGYPWGPLGRLKDAKRIMLHCTATPPGREVDWDDLHQWHVVENGWFGPAYHFLIQLKETNPGFADIQILRDTKYEGAGCAGQNHDTLHICYVGGIMGDGSQRAEDNRTSGQIATMKWLIKHLMDNPSWPALDDKSDIVGHNQFAAKACPSFDVPQWVEQAIREGESGEPEPGDPTMPMFQILNRLADAEAAVAELTKVVDDLVRWKNDD